MLRRGKRSGQEWLPIFDRPSSAVVVNPPSPGLDGAVPLTINIVPVAAVPGSDSPQRSRNALHAATMRT